MLKKLRNNLSIWEDWYNTYQKKIKLSTNVKIKNKHLYRELEQACQKNFGVLTYTEYVTIDQFGTYGFYATSGKHGKTDIDYRWSKALASYCNKNRHDRIIEFGCGAGELGIATCKEYKKITNRSMNWIGIEIDKRLHKKIIDAFKANNIAESLETIVSTIDEIPNRKNAVIIFPYSLDSIPPNIFLNTLAYNSYPNAMLGITVANGMLSEMIIPRDILDKKGLKLENGFFTQNNITYKLSGWKLRRGQRAFISTDAFNTIYNYAQKFTDASMIIIDEFSKEPWAFSLGNLGTPKSLYEENLNSHERNRYYRESGKRNLYYPIYRESLLKYLSTIGYREINYEIEQKRAAELGGNPWFSIRKNYATLAFTAKNFVEKKMPILPIPSPPQRLL